MQVVAVHEETEHPSDHSERRLPDDTHEWSDDGIQERIRLGLYSSATLLRLDTGGRRLAQIVAGIEQRRVLDSVKLLERGDDQGEQGQSLLG